MKSELQQIEDVRKNIKEYEKHKKTKHLSTAGILAGAGLGMVSAYKGSNIGTAASGLAAVSSGVLRARSRQKEQQALGKIKRFYDLRRIEAQNREKTAMLTGAGDAVITGAGIATGGWHTPLLHTVAAATATGLGIPLEYVPFIATATGAAADIALTPRVAAWQGNSMRRDAFVNAKEIRAKEPLTPKETIARGKSIAWLGRSRAINEMKDSKWKTVKKTLLKPYYDIFGQGAQVGEVAGKIIKNVDTMSPRHGDLLLNAVENQTGLLELDHQMRVDIGKYKKALDEVKGILSDIPLAQNSAGDAGGKAEAILKKILKDPDEAIAMAKKLRADTKIKYDAYAKAVNTLDSSIDEVPFLRGFLKATSKSGEGIAREAWRNPNSTIELAEKFKDVVKRSVRASKATAGILALTGLGHAAGSYRYKHPLAKDRLPEELTDTIPKDNALEKEGPRFSAALLGV